MLENVKLLLGFTDSSQDNLISLLIDMAKEEATSFCHLSTYSSSLDGVVTKMVIQNYNKMGNEGFSASSIGGVVSESYLDGYSKDILTELKRHRKIVTV